MMTYDRLFRCLKCSGSDMTLRYDVAHDMLIRQCVRCGNWWWEDTLGNEIPWTKEKIDAGVRDEG